MRSQIWYMSGYMNVHDCVFGLRGFVSTGNGVFVGFFRVHRIHLIVRRSVLLGVVEQVWTLGSCSYRIYLL